jgi:hypothetical protein
MMNTSDSSTLYPTFSTNDRKSATLIWGFTLGFGVLTATKAVEQTIKISRKIGARKSIYLWMVWILYIDNFAASVIMWLYINGIIKARSESVFTNYIFIC